MSTTTLTIPRQKLIEALKAKAEANQKAYDQKVAEIEAAKGKAAELSKKMESLMPGGVLYTTDGQYTFNRKQLDSLFQTLGIGGNAQQIAKPQLYTKEIVQLELATDETLQFAVTDPILNCLG